MFSGHQGMVSCIATTLEGRLLFTGSSDSTVRSWRVESGEVLKVYEGHTASVTCLLVCEVGCGVCLACGVFGLWCLWSVVFLVRGVFGLWCFWSVLPLVCVVFGLWCVFWLVVQWCVVLLFFLFGSVVCSSMLLCYNTIQCNTNMNIIIVELNP